MSMPICKVCGKEKSENDFYTSNKSTCKECVKERNYYARVKRNTEKAKLEGKEYNPRGRKEKMNIPEGYAYCNECKQILPIEEFGKYHKNNKEYLNSVCKKCAVIRVLRCPNRAETQTRSNLNKETRRKSDEEYRKHLLEIDKKYYKSEKGIKQKLLERARERAKKRNLEIDITVDDIILPKKCPILEIPLSPGNQYDYLSSYSLDRIDNSKGYIKGNIRVISTLANIMKNSASNEQLITFSKNILNYINSENN